MLRVLPLFKMMGLLHACNKWKGEKMSKIIKIMSGTMEAYLDFAFVDTQENLLVLASVFKRGTDLRGFTAISQNNSCTIIGDIDNKRICKTISCTKTKNVFSIVNSGAEIVSHAVMKYEEQEKKTPVRYLYLNRTNLYGSFRDYLMNNFDLPLLEEWTEAIYHAALADGVIMDNCLLYQSEGSTKSIPLYGKDTALEDIIIIKTMMSQQWLDETLSRLLRNKKVCICEEEMKHLDELDDENANVDTYYKEHNESVLGNIKEFMKPKTDFHAIVKNLALKNKKPLPQQANAIVGAANHLRDNYYCIFNMGMGCGKTFTSIATVETFFVSKWLRKNPHKTLRDCYLDKNAINYRVIVISPKHIMKKWKSEIEDIVPYAKVQLLTKQEEVIEIKEKGKERDGREFYIISKDFMKLESSSKPTPYKVMIKDKPMWECRECGAELEFGGLRKPITQTKCDCGCRQFKRVASHTPVKGLICPDCGEVILDSNGEPIKAISFATKTTNNYKCRACGAKLWQSTVSNLNSQKCDEGKWIKYTHFKNRKKADKTSVWILKGNEAAYCSEKGIPLEELERSPNRRNRKISPADFIHRYLKGFFDFGIVDELHKFKGGGSAQGIAMHDIIKSCHKVIGLTGTLAGGYSEDLFYLFFRLEPRRMKEYGFDYNKISEFADVYGTQEAAFEFENSSGMNANSKGKQTSQKKSKPGISPLIFSNFLIDRCIFLNIEDLGAHIPELDEQIVLVDPEPDTLSEYKGVLATIKSYGGNMLNALSAASLQFGLAWLDKPYDYGPIIHPKTGTVVCRTKDYFPEEGHYLPKEKALIDFINQEQKENRRVFVYAEYTGKEHCKVTDRLKKIIEEGCKLTGRVEILNSTSPKSEDREAWLKKKATEGVQVIITNPACVETGLDFIFKVDDVTYNYPSICFFQCGFNLFTMMQAARRHLRANQTELCKTRYFAYSGTAQQTACILMANKQIASAAIQGNFSSEGLAAMANSVDARLQLLQALYGDDDIDKDEGLDIQQKFNSMKSKKIIEEYDTSGAVDFYSLTELSSDVVDQKNIETNVGSIFNITMENITSFVEDDTSPEELEAIIQPVTAAIIEQKIAVTILKPKKKKQHEKQLSLFELGFV